MFAYDTNVYKRLQLYHKFPLLHEIFMGPTWNITKYCTAQLQGISGNLRESFTIMTKATLQTEPWESQKMVTRDLL